MRTVGDRYHRLSRFRSPNGGTVDFDWQSVDYHRSGDFRDMAIGTGYVCVDGETGQCRMLGALESAGTDLF